MLPIVGLFGNEAEAQRARDALCARGVLAEEVSLQPMTRPLWTSIVAADVSAEEAALYEPYREGNSVAVLVRSSRLPTDEIDSILEAHRGLIVQVGVPPPLADAPLPESEDR